MSLSSRLFWDRVKRSFGRHISFPCPPYGSPDYWNNVYKSMDGGDAHEWGGLLVDELLDGNYQTLTQQDLAPETQNNMPRTLDDVINVNRLEEERKFILLLGCGNSMLGEQMAERGWAGPLLQVDVASNVVESMTVRCEKWIKRGLMEIVEDDATQLSAFGKDTMEVTLDKGLVDALFCANEFGQISEVKQSVHRVTKPGGVFCFFSFSRPEFMLPRFQGHDMLWPHVEVCQLDDRILLYRCQKGEEEERAKIKVSKKIKKRRR